MEVERRTLQAKLDARTVPALQEEKIRLRERAAAARRPPATPANPAPARAPPCPHPPHAPARGG